MATANQIDTITNLSQQKGFSSSRAAAVEYGFDPSVSFHYLSTDDATGLIEWLKTYSANTATSPADDFMSKYAPKDATIDRTRTKCIVDSMPAVILRNYITATGREMVAVLIDDCDEETIAINSPRLTLV